MQHATGSAADPQWVAILATTHELDPDEVIRDVLPVANGRGSARACAALPGRHAWRPSLPASSVRAPGSSRIPRP